MFCRRDENTKHSNGETLATVHTVQYQWSALRSTLSEPWTPAAQHH